MKFGITLQALNTQDWERVTRGDYSEPSKVADVTVWNENLHLGDLAEPLGFDSIWTTEHHTTPYCMIPNPLLLLAYFAGRTKKIGFGTMVIVLPWHHPFRVAGEIAFASVLMQGRRLQIGVGRGTSKSEFEAHEIDRNESRGRFAESIEVIRTALTNERFSFHGEHFNIPETSVRPRPASNDLVPDMIGAFVSPESLDIVADLRLGALFTGAAAPEKVRDDVARFNRIRADKGLDPMQPIIFHWVFCAETEEEAIQGAQEYMGLSTMEIALHYGLADPSAYEGLTGYEHYQKQARDAATVDPMKALEDLLDMQIIGTPAQCIEKIRYLQELTSAREMIGLFHYGGMPIEVAERNMRLFAEQVLPAVHAMDTPLHPAAQGEFV